MLFVCAADVCRSPTAAVLLRHAVRDHAFGDIVIASSSAARASKGNQRCALAAKQVGARGADASPMLQGAPHAIQLADIEEANLVLAADRSIAADVLRLAPRQRSRVFTIREGAALAAAVVSELRHHSLRGSARHLARSDDPEASLSWLVDEMDAARGKFAVPAPHRRLGLHVRQDRTKAAGSGSGYDVPDVHQDGRRQHRWMVDLLADATSQLSDAMVQVSGNAHGSAVPADQ
nr:hypothetical protein [Leekyejoonella antrihumi]